MSTYKQVLKVEEKYDNFINSNKSNFNSEVENYEKKLKNELELKKTELEKNLEKEYLESIDKLNSQAKLIIDESIKNSNRIKENADISSIVNILINEVKKNV